MLMSINQIVALGRNHMIHLSEDRLCPLSGQSLQHFDQLLDLLIFLFFLAFLDNRHLCGIKIDFRMQFVFLAIKLLQSTFSFLDAFE